MNGARVVLHQDSVLDVRLSRNSGTQKVDKEGNIATQGYRIQLFSDNKRNSREEAELRSDVVAGDMPEIPIYVTYLSPFGVCVWATTALTKRPMRRCRS